MSWTLYQQTWQFRYNGHILTNHFLLKLREENNNLISIKQIEVVIKIFPQKKPQGPGGISDDFIQLLKKK